MVIAASVRSANGEWAAGPETLPDWGKLAANRFDLHGSMRRAYPLDDEFYADRAVDYSKIAVPILSWRQLGWRTVASARQFFNGFPWVGIAKTNLASKCNGPLAHWSALLTITAMICSGGSSTCFLKREESGWKDQPRVLLNVRHPVEKFVPRAERTGPLPRAEWTKYHLEPAWSAAFGKARPSKPAAITYDANGDGLTFLVKPDGRDTESVPPWRSTHERVIGHQGAGSCFVILRVFQFGHKEITFRRRA